MGMRWQRMESHALRSAYGMKKQQKGILVRHVQPTYETAKHLKSDDIIMRFDGVQVASDGTVPFRYGCALWVSRQLAKIQYAAKAPCLSFACHVASVRAFAQILLLVCPVIDSFLCFR